MTELALIVYSGQGQVKGTQARLESFVTRSRTGADFSRDRNEVHGGSNTTSDTGNKGRAATGFRRWLEHITMRHLPTKAPCKFEKAKKMEAWIENMDAFEQRPVSATKASF